VSCKPPRYRGSAINSPNRHRKAPKSPRPQLANIVNRVVRIIARGDTRKVSQCGRTPGQAPAAWYYDVALRTAAGLSGYEPDLRRVVKLSCEPTLVTALLFVDMGDQHVACGSAAPLEKAHAILVSEECRSGENSGRGG